MQFSLLYGNWKMDNKVVHHRGRRFKRASDKSDIASSALPPPTPPSRKSRDLIDASFSYKRFKPLPSIDSRDALVETDSAIDVRSPNYPSSHMTWSHDHLPHTHKPTIIPREQPLTVPPEPSVHDPDCVTLCVRLPDGSRAQRRFDYSIHTLSSLLAFAMTSLPKGVGAVSPSEVELATSTVPKVVFRDWSLTLGQAGLTQNTLLCLSIL